MTSNVEQKLEVFLQRLIRVIDKYDLDTQIKLSDLIYKFYYLQVGNLEKYDDEEKNDFNYFVAMKYLKDQFNFFLSSKKSFISLDVAYEIVKRLNSIVRKRRKHAETSFSDSRIPENVLFSVYNSFYLSLYEQSDEDDSSSLLVSRRYLYNISQENRIFLNSLSPFGLNKLILSIRKIIIPRLEKMNIDDEQKVVLLNSCIDKLRIESDISEIEEMFKKRSSEAKYIWLWAKIRMRWVSILNKTKRKTEQNFISSKIAGYENAR